MANINPPLEELEALIGDWDMELSNASFLPDPKTMIRGSASFEWIEDGDYLVIRQGKKEAGANYSTWIIGRDESSSNYTILYSDDRSVSRVYEMTLKNGAWKIWRNSPTFYQRFEGKISKDKNNIDAYWEKSIDGKTWEHDFDIKYIRRK